MNVGEDIVSVAERLRLVRGARGKFLRLWAIDRSMIDPLVDRLALDLMDTSISHPPAEAGPGPAGQTGQDSVTHPDAPVVDES
jgi:hypothetical protein